MFGSNQNFAAIPGFIEKFKTRSDDLLEDGQKAEICLAFIQYSVCTVFIMGNQRAKEDFSKVTRGTRRLSAWCFRYDGLHALRPVAFLAFLLELKHHLADAYARVQAALDPLE